jgi:predicted helicase
LHIFHLSVAGLADTGDFQLSDLAFPATTSARELVRSYKAIHAKDAKKGEAARMTVVFSTYHSIQASAINNDPNDWCREHNNPRYIVDLLKRVTRVSLETMKIVNGLPALNER